MNDEIKVKIESINSLSESSIQAVIFFNSDLKGSKTYNSNTFNVRLTDFVTNFDE